MDSFQPSALHDAGKVLDILRVLGCFKLKPKASYGVAGTSTTYIRGPRHPSERQYPREERQAYSFNVLQAMFL